MKKLWIGIGILVIVALATVAIVVQTNKVPEPEVIKIGAILPLTGPAGYIGESLKKGMELALDEINNAIEKELKIEIIFEDSMGDPKAGVSAWKKLSRDNEIKVCVASLSSVVNPIIPLADKDKIPLIATVVSSKGIAEKSPWVFRFFTKAEDDAKLIAEYAYKTLGMRKVAIIHVQDEFGVSYAEVFKQVFENTGGHVVIAENFSSGETDFRTILSKIKPLDIDGIYILSYANNIASIPRQMREMGISDTILSLGTIAQKFVIEQAGGSVEDAYYTTTAFNTFKPKTDEMKRFVKGFQQRYGSYPEYFEVFGYDIVNLINEAIRKSGGNRSEIQRGILSIQDLKGVAGNIVVSKNGEINFPIVIRKIVNGQPSLPLLNYISK